MEIKLNDRTLNWSVKKIGVVGPGIVGMPMAALLADARIKIGTNDPAKVVVLQRNSKTSGWKVDAINAGKSVIGGIEPGLDDIVRKNVEDGILSASHDFNDLSDADVVLVSVQTDKKGLEPDYGPMFGALESLAEALTKKPAGNVPLIVFESTLAPSTMMTIMKPHFAKYGLEEGKDILLGNSPNRVMPGRLVERVISSDKLVGGLHPETPRMITEIYSKIVTNGKLFQTNSITAEIEKTLENAYRDVRIAFASEIVRYCDNQDIDYYQVRNMVNEMLAQTDKASSEPNAVPTGGLLIPNIGVGGHCLPKDGILLWWRKIESGADTSNSLIIHSRVINNASPKESVKLAEKTFGSIKGSSVALLGAAYRFNSEDTRNSPTLELGKLLKGMDCEIIIHDPYVKPDDQNILKYDLEDQFTNDLSGAVKDADYIFVCTAHQYYLDHFDDILADAQFAKGLFDGCNIYHENEISKIPYAYAGIGRGTKDPSDEFVKFVYDSFMNVDKGVANELNGLIEFFNKNYADSEFNKAQFPKVRELAHTCSTGCEIVKIAPVDDIPEYRGFSSELAKMASAAS
ncbi:MAG: nucleotide sugar dehydrogenase [Bacteroidales bacterium]|nr:nucleotide sugar dehydrogenase [Bacteroidales bacterium]